MTTSANAHLLDPLPLTLPLTVDGSLYNVEPAAGQPARFGIVLRPIGSEPLPLLQKIIQVSDVQLRKSDFGLNTVLTDIPNVAHAVGEALTVPIDITAIDIHLNGTVGGQGVHAKPDLVRNQDHQVHGELLREPEPDGHRTGHLHLGELRRTAVLADVQGLGRRARAIPRPSPRRR